MIIGAWIVTGFGIWLLWISCKPHLDINEKACRLKFQRLRAEILMCCTSSGLSVIEYYANELRTEYLGKISNKKLEAISDEIFSMIQDRAIELQNGKRKAI